ncbi:hypothetical protein [Salinivirga cyanobacteriivorans]|nr:hypothetical protein [Salinivirga cyanobacteriivorans]
MKNIALKISLILCMLVLISDTLFGQFYNGHRMRFGKNRVQYRDFYWQHYDFQRYKVYFHQGGDNTARYVGLRARDILTEMEYRLDYRLDGQVNFIVYNDLLDFRQSNIGLVSGNDQYNIGGTTTIANNKVMIYNYGTHRQLDRQVRRASAELLINEILVGSRFSDRLANSALISYPEWFIKGLIAYYGNEFAASEQQSIKDGLLNGKYKKMQWLTGKDAELAGFSFWTYVAMNYGEPALRDIMYLSRVSKNINNAIVFVTGVPFRYLLREWAEYSTYRYEQEGTGVPGAEAKKIKKRTKKKAQYSNLVFSPDERYFAWSRNESGKVKIYIQNAASGKRQKVFAYGHKLPQKIDRKYPVVRWHPKLNMLSWVYEHEQQIKLCFYDVNSTEINARNIQYINRMLDYDFNSDGTQIVFSGIHDGKTDLFTLNLASNEQNRLTDDLPDELNPKFTPEGNIIFSSNRNKPTGDTLQSHLDLYLTNARHFEPVKVVATPGNQTKPIVLGKDYYLYLNDQNGIQNRFVANYDSAIQFVDTAIHYRFFTEQKPLTDLRYGLIEHDVANSRSAFADLHFYNQRYHLLQKPFDLTPLQKTLNITEQKAFFTTRRKFYNKQIERLKEQQRRNDSLIDINNYTFEFEKKQKSDQRWPDFEADSLWVLKRKLYFTTFYTNYTVNQVDFSQLNRSYQVYTGGGVFFNPGFNVLTKFGAADLFEDYKLTAGFRLAANFTGNEYLISIENLKSRLDKQLILHRMGSEEYTDNELKRSYSYQTMLVLKYPFSQVSSVRLTGRLRLDQIVYPAINNETLVKPDDFRLWGGMLAEYVYDNTRSLGLNLYSGTRAKAFFEQYSRLEQNTGDHMFVVGTDVRHYIQIHRQLIWANRFAASSSFGNALLIYYLGGVDNWMSVSGNGYFDQTIPVDKSKNWAFQTVATNMRGFQQNIRNGNSFALINSELRWPVIKYVFNRPLNSDLLDNFMIAGFFDVGSAWYGWDITNTDNFYRYDYIENGPVSVRIDKRRDPLVAGYGFGFRTRVFGYYLRFDWAWGIENKKILDRQFYFSINLDF